MLFRSWNRLFEEKGEPTARNNIENAYHPSDFGFGAEKEAAEDEEEGKRRRIQNDYR